MHVRLTGDFKLSLGVSVSVDGCVSRFKLSLGVSVSVDGCVSRLSLYGPMMDWRPVQRVPRLLPNDRWDRLQPSATLNWIKRT